MKIDKHLTPELRRWMRAAPPPSNEQQDRLEVRLLALYITWSFIFDQVGPISAVYGIAPSPLFGVASLAHSTQLIGGLYVLALVMALPHGVALLLFPNTLARRWPRKGAAAAACLTVCIWCCLALRAIPMDLGALPWLYGRHAVDSMFLAFVYAISLNAQLLRALSKLVNR